MNLGLNNNEIIQDKKRKSSLNHILRISCDKCSYLSNGIYSENCISCLSKTLYLGKKKKKNNSIYLENYDYFLDTNILSYFFEYHSFIEKINQILKRINNTRNNCDYNEFKCPIFSQSLYNLDIKINIYNPISFYCLIRDIHSILSNHNPSSQCLKCNNELTYNFRNLIDLLANLSIILKFKNFMEKKELFKKFANFYEYLLSDLSLRLKKEELEDQNSKLNSVLFENYNIEKYKLYKCEIYSISNEIEKLYTIKRFFDNTVKEEFFIGILNDTYKKLDLANIKKIISIENLIDFYHSEALKYIDQKYKLSDLNKNRIGLLVATKILNLEKIFPLLIDDYIEEIFLDSPIDMIYINHQKYGRCRTHIKLKYEEIERIKTLFRLYSGKRLDHSNPSIKLVLKNKYFYCRFAVDIEPINYYKFSLDIRKMNKNIFTIQDLLKNKTLNTKMAAFLFFCILKQANITVVGTTDSGKTTLINALDLITPKDYRKIYIENVIESLDEIKYGKHQLKYKVESLEDGIDSPNTKSGQIKKLLHRTPDLIYLGEILTEEESKAMFHCLAAGLKGFQTIHADSIESLINRFIYHFNIDKACLNDLDIVVLMKKYRKNNHRKIFSINEIVLNSNNSIKYNPIFQYNPTSDNWDEVKSLFSTKLTKKIIKFESFDKESFNFLINLYKKGFEHLYRDKKIENKELIEYFNKISYYSNDSNQNLENFIAKEF
ncbi:MAG: type II/IV secretion system ATPase subunit [Candidatus Lokiarchaeota archaeon]|nr:type II/IV secretion system ATPase subunit [Candidatus Lokiarchaeota archaeon]